VGNPVSRRQKWLLVIVALAAVLVFGLASSAYYFAGYVECGYYSGVHLDLSWENDESPCFWCQRGCGPYRPASLMSSVRRANCCWYWNLYASTVILRKYGVGGIVRVLQHRMGGT
jgi:hypothetical protein